MDKEDFIIEILHNIGALEQVSLNEIWEKIKLLAGVNSK